jgi:hypothetical protein
MANQGNKTRVASTSGEQRQRASARVPSSARVGARVGLSSSAREADQTYALASVLYHSLQGAEAARRYIEDAQAGGDDELVRFFEDSQYLDNQRASRAKRLLASRLAEGPEDEDQDSVG